MSRVLIATNEVIGPQMAGPAIRCAELARQLQHAGHAVIVLGGAGTRSPESELDVRPSPGPAQLRALALSQAVILVQGLALRQHPELAAPGVPLVVDLYDPFPLALLEQERQRAEAERWALSREISGVSRELLLSGDFFICASERQRDLWVGALMALGRINPATWAADDSLRHLIDVVPFGLPGAPLRLAPDEPSPYPEAVSGDDLVLLWAGGIYNWFDPLTLIRAVAQVANSQPRVKLLFMATGHPNPGVPPRMWMPQRAIELARELGVLDTHVFFNREWVPYEKRGEWLGRATWGVSTHFDHAETRFSFRTRVLDYLWAGLPILATRGDVLADLIETSGLGWTVPAEDVVALVAALGEMVRTAADHGSMRERIAKVASEFTWTRASQPLLAFCQTPWQAADQPLARSRYLTGARAASVQGRVAAGLARRGLASVRSRGLAATASEVLRWWRRRRRA
ncbi:MAG: glycosyltransferase [Candidatus Dormibacteria bacterium]